MLDGMAARLRNTTYHCMTLSTSPAEYVAMAHGAKTSLLANEVVLDFVQPHLSGNAIAMYEDNKEAMALAENPQGS